MGLDFCLYKKKKSIQISDFCKEEVLEKAEELAYGRKCWELVHKLATNEDIKNRYCILTLEKWEKLIKEIEPISNLLEEIKEAYMHYDFYLEHLEDFDNSFIDRTNIFTKEDEDLVIKYEYWYNMTFNSTPVLGYEFSTAYIDNFYKAKDKVIEAINDPEYEVIMVISF